MPVVDGLFRYFRAEECFEIKGRGRVWVGPCPFTWNKDDGLSAWGGEWLVSHPDIDYTKAYKVTGVESWAIQIIRQGSPVGILIEPIA